MYKVTEKKKTKVGHCLAQLVEQASHVQRLCPRCSRPEFASWPEALCCVSLPLSLILFPVPVFSCSIDKAKVNRAKKKLQKYQQERAELNRYIHKWNRLTY